MRATFKDSITAKTEIVFNYDSSCWYVAAINIRKTVSIKTIQFYASVCKVSYGILTGVECNNMKSSYVLKLDTYVVNIGSIN